MRNTIRQKLYDKLNNFFWRFLLSNLLLLSVPFAAILITYHTAADSIEEEIRASNENSLYQFFLSMDTLLEDMVSLSLSLSGNDSIRDYSLHSLSDIQSPSIDSYYIRKSLSTLNGGYYGNFFVAYHKLDKIIGTDNSLSTELFYDAYYKDVMSFSDFMKVINAPDKNVRPTLVAVGEDPESSLLGIVCSFAFSRNVSSPPDYSIVIVLDREQQEQMFQNAGLHNEGILTVFDGKGQLLISSRALPEELRAVCEAPLELEAAPARTDFRNLRGFEVRQFSSDVLRAEYMSAIPKSVFWNRLNALRSFSLLCIFLCALVGFAVSWFLARLNHSPITAVLDTIKGHTSSLCDSQTNELAYIRDTLNSAFEEISQLSIQKKAQTDAVRNKFLLNALMGNADIDLNGAEDDSFLSNHIPLLSDRFGVILYQVDLEKESPLGKLTEKENIRTLYFIFANVLEELCAERHRGYVVSISEEKYACIMNFSGNQDEKGCFMDMSAINLQCREFLESKFGFHLFSALSETHSGINGISVCYREAADAVRYLYLYGREASVLYSQIREKHFRYTSANNAKIRNLLTRYIKDTAVSQTASDIMTRILSLAGLGTDASLESYHCFQYEALVIFRTLINELNAGNLEMEREMDDYLLHAVVFEEVKAFLADALDKLRLFYQESQQTWTICDQAAQYLRDNFSNPGLSNGVLGDFFQISPSYLSRLFKNQKGISLSDYLNQLRIAHAKLLLETTSLNMEEVAAQSGYLSSSTLIKTFKKSEGITPGAYRSLKDLPQ